MKRLTTDQKKKLSRFFKHPLFITLIGTLVASAVIPWIAGRANETAVVARARIELALETVNTSSSVNAILNRIKTEFESYEDDSLRATPDDYRKRRDELHHRIYALHSDLDDVAWWWPWRISYRARVLKLISSKEFESTQKEITRYNENVVATLRELKPAWAAYLSDDPSTQRPVELIMPSLKNNLDALQKQRDELVRKIAAILEGEQRNEKH